MGRKKAGVILGAILLAAASAAGIWYFLGNSGKDSNDRVYVQKVSAIMGVATGAQNRYSGVVQPQKTVEVNVDSERTVKEILVEVGDEVTEGTPLFSYDTEDLKMELEQAKLELENQDIEISNYRNQIQELTKERNAAAEGDKFEYTTQIQTIETQIKQAEYEKSSKKLEMDKVQKKIDSSQVNSTASGVIKSINDGKSPEEESSAFMTILSTGEYRIQGMANEQNVGMISGGVDVIVRSRVDEELTWTGTVESLDTGEPNTDSDEMSSGEENMSSSSKYPFYVVMDDADGLMLGQHVLIELDEGQTEPKEGIWLYSGYIVQEGAEGAGLDNIQGDTEGYFDPEDDSWEDDLYSDPDILEDEGLIEGSYEDTENYAQPAEHRENTAMLARPSGEDGNDLISQPAGDSGSDLFSQPADNAGDDLFSQPADDAGDDLFSQPADDSGDGLFPQSSGDLGEDGMPESPEGDSGDTEAAGGTDGTGSTAYVWADNGHGRLEKRTVELGEYDADLDEYEILSGLTEDDLIAWPMEGLYEGVKTVTDMDEVDYTSDLYNMEGTESLSGTEYNLDDLDLDNLDLDNADWTDGEDSDNADWTEGDSDDENWTDGEESDDADQEDDDGEDEE